MGGQDWADAPALVYPAIALPLFSADTTNALGVTAAARTAAPPWRVWAFSTRHAPW